MERENVPAALAALNQIFEIRYFHIRYFIDECVEVYDRANFDDVGQLENLG